MLFDGFRGRVERLAGLLPGKPFDSEGAAFVYGGVLWLFTFIFFSHRFGLWGGVSAIAFPLVLERIITLGWTFFVWSGWCLLGFALLVEALFGVSILWLGTIQDAARLWREGHALRISVLLVFAFICLVWISFPASGSRSLEDIRRVFRDSAGASVRMGVVLVAGFAGYLAGVVFGERGVFVVIASLASMGVVMAFLPGLMSKFLSAAAAQILKQEGVAPKADLEAAVAPPSKPLDRIGAVLELAKSEAGAGRDESPVETGTSGLKVESGFGLADQDSDLSSGSEGAADSGNEAGNIYGYNWDDERDVGDDEGALPTDGMLVDDEVPFDDPGLVEDERDAIESEPAVDVDAAIAYVHRLSANLKSFASDDEPGKDMRIARFVDHLRDAPHSVRVYASVDLDLMKIFSQLDAGASDSEIIAEVKMLPDGAAAVTKHGNTEASVAKVTNFSFEGEVKDIAGRPDVGNSIEQLERRPSAPKVTEEVVAAIGAVVAGVAASAPAVGAIDPLAIWDQFEALPLPDRQTFEREGQGLPIHDPSFLDDGTATAFLNALSRYDGSAAKALRVRHTSLLLTGQEWKSDFEGSLKVVQIVRLWVMFLDASAVAHIKGYDRNVFLSKLALIWMQSIVDDVTAEAQRLLDFGIKDIVVSDRMKLLQNFFERAVFPVFGDFGPAVKGGSFRDRMVHEIAESDRRFAMTAKPAVEDLPPLLISNEEAKLRGQAAALFRFLPREDQDAIRVFEAMAVSALNLDDLIVNEASAKGGDKTQHPLYSALMSVEKRALAAARIVLVKVKDKTNRAIILGARDPRFVKSFDSLIARQSQIDQAKDPIGLVEEKLVAAANEIDGLKLLLQAKEQECHNLDLEVKKSAGSDEVKRAVESFLAIPQLGEYFKPTMNGAARLIAFHGDRKATAVVFLHGGEFNWSVMNGGDSLRCESLKFSMDLVSIKTDLEMLLWDTEFSKFRVRYVLVGARVLENAGPKNVVLFDDLRESRELQMEFMGRDYQFDEARGQPSEG